MAAEHGEPRFLLGRDDLEADAGLAPDPLDEMAAVDRAAAGLGRDRAGEADPAALQFLGADAQRGDGAVHRGFGQLAGRRHALAHAHHPRKGVDHGEAVIARAGDEQAAIVGAEIDRAIGVARRPFAGRRALGKRGDGFWSGRLRSRGGLLRHRTDFSLSYRFGRPRPPSDLKPLYMRGRERQGRPSRRR